MKRLINHKLGLRFSPPLTGYQVRKAQLVAAHLDKLGPAPDVGQPYDKPLDLQTGGNYQMFGNDTCGDCAWAAAAHGELLVTANTGKIIMPTTQAVIADYSKATGYDPNAPLNAKGENPTDQGTDPTEMSKWVRDNTCFGDKVIATAHIDPRNLNHQKWAGIFLGPMILGYNLPYDAETQFNAGLPWTKHFMQRLRQGLGGHAVTWITNDKRGVQTMCWGRKQWAEWAWHKDNIMEIEVWVMENWTRQNGKSPYGQAANELIADLQAVGQ